jgi:hypothetical protein
MPSGWSRRSGNEKAACLAGRVYPRSRPARVACEPGDLEHGRIPLPAGRQNVDSISLTTTLHVEHGTLNVAAIGGAEVVGSGSSTVTLTGSVAEIDMTLGAANNVLYHCAFNFSGIEHLTMTSRDGSSLSDTDVLDIQVAPAIAAYTINGITRPAHNLDKAISLSNRNGVAAYGVPLSVTRFAMTISGGFAAGRPCICHFY